MPREVEAEINSLPPNTALGLYSWSVRILKVAHQALSTSLTILHNKSVQRGIYPSKFENAKIIPVFQNEDEADINNYSNYINRIFEKLMYKRLRSFIDKYDILSESQYGFREHCSTQHALNDILTKNNIHAEYL